MYFWIKCRTILIRICYFPIKNFLTGSRPLWNLLDDPCFVSSFVTWQTILTPYLRVGSR